MQLVHAFRPIGAPTIDADHTHAECLAQARRLAADAADAEDQGGALGQVQDAGVERSRRILAAHLLRQVGVKIAREGQHERHDVRADVIVEDLAEVGDLNRVRDQLGIVEASRRRGVGRLQPAQTARSTPNLGRNSAEGGIGIGDVAHRILHGLGLEHAHTGLVGGDALRPVPPHVVVRRQHDHREGDIFHGNSAVRVGCRK